MKKTLKKGVALCMAVFATASCFAACGDVEEEYDPNKTQLYVKVFNGGAGTAWIETLRDEFNKNNDEYEVILRYEKISASSVINEIELDTATSDIYFTSEIQFQSGIYKDYFEDLTDVLDTKVDGENGKTIGEKMQNAENWKKMASKNGQGCYVLPYLDAIMGFVYNHDMFVENGWLSFAGEEDEDALAAQGITFEVAANSNLIFKSSTGVTNYEEGDYILTAGKDGKYGTYDDGQPTTEEEFDNMIEDITLGNKKAKAYVYAGLYDQYSNHIVNAIAAQYVGPTTFNNMLQYDTKGEVLEMHSGDDKAITFEKGYEVYDAQGIYEGLRFADKNLNDQTIVDANSFKVASYSHTDAQNDFLLGYKKAEGYPAMLVEGVWWENEARAMFNTIAESGYPDRGFGKQDYRYMLMPAIEGQKGIDGQGNGTVFSASDTGGIVMKKQTDAAKLAKLKEFLCMTLTEEVLVNFTKTTGINRPFDYTLSQADLAEMTPFARNVYNIYNDKENIKIIRPEVTLYAQPITFTSSMDSRFLPLRVGTTIYASYVRSVRLAGGLENALASIPYDQAKWDTFISDAKSQGFYQ